jgi:A/G-specific adenine glycosylase
MAEVMLHRTQAPQVVPIYERFIKRYPNVLTLAQAGKKELHSTLYSLGLRWRIRLIRDMAVRLLKNFNGSIPEGKDDLLSLPGVSDYIASAVRCFAWNYPEPLVDTNTVRVIGRVFGLEIKDSSRRNRHFQELIVTLVDREKPRLYNFALLDLADQLCHKEKEPECERCPLQRWCLYGQRKCGTLA